MQKAPEFIYFRFDFNYGSCVFLDKVAMTGNLRFEILGLEMEIREQMFLLQNIKVLFNLI